VSWDTRFRTGGGGLNGSGDGVARGRNVSFEIGGKTSTGPGGPGVLTTSTHCGSLMTCSGDRCVVQTESDVDVDRPVPNGRGYLEMERILTTWVAEL